MADIPFLYCCEDLYEMEIEIIASEYCCFNELAIERLIASHVYYLSTSHGAIIIVAQALISVQFSFGLCYFYL